MFEKNFEKKFERATKAFTKAVDDLDGLVTETNQHLDDLYFKQKDIEKEIATTMTTRDKVAKVSSKLKAIFGE